MVEAFFTFWYIIFAIIVTLGLVFGPKLSRQINANNSNTTNSTNRNSKQELFIKLETRNFRKAKKQYIKSKSWKAKRQQILRRDNYTCQMCGTCYELDVHHIVYTNLGKEKPEELVTLCRNCHDKVHKLYGIPQTYNEYRSFYAPITITK